MKLKPNYKILIVDDVPEDRETLCRYLRQDDRYDYQIIEAELVSEALEICDRSLPDLILLDYFLPDNDGLVFLQEWQRRYGNTLAPVVILAGQGDEGIAVEAMKSGAQDYCVKGKLTAAGLCQTVQTVLQQLELKRQIARQQEQQYLVNRIALRIRQSLQLNDVLQTTVAEVRQFLQADRILIYKFAPDMSGIIVAEAVLPQWMSCLNLQINDTCFQEGYGEQYCRGKVFTASDIQTAGLSFCHINLLERFQVKANLVVPLLLNSKSTPVSESENQQDLWGLLIAHQCDRSRQWQDTEVDLLQQLAVQLAMAIQQAEMYERVQAELYQRIEAEFRERQRVAAEFQALVENATDIILRVDRDLRYLYFNPAFEKVLQQPASNLVGKTPQDLGVSEEIIAIWRVTLDRIMVTKTQETIEHPFPDFNSQLWYQTRIVPELNEAGEVDSFLCIARDISKGKRNEETLQFQAQILDKIHDAVVSTDLFGIIQSWNKGAEKLYGYTAAEIIGQNISILYEDINELQTIVIAPLMTKGIHEVEVRTRSKSGAEIYISLRLSILRDEQGDIIRLIGCSNDISDRKKVEQELQQLNQELEGRVQRRTAELQESQRFIQSITDNTPNIIYIYDLQEERNIYGNNEVLEILGYSPEQIQMMGNSFLTDLTHPDDLEEFVAHLSSLQNLNDGEKRNYEYRMHDINGQWHWFVSRHAVFKRDNNGQVKQVVGTAQDITERKFIEEQLRNSETHLRAAQRIAGLGSWEFEVQTQDIIWSAEIFHIFGRNPEQGNPTFEELQQLIHPEDRALHNRTVQQAINQGQAYEIEFRLYRPNGTLRYLLARGEPIFNSEGQVVRLIGTALDITERKLAEEILLQRERQLADSLEELQTIEEELRLQNEELWEAQQLIEVERRRYQDLFSNAPDAYIVTNHSGKILAANQMAEVLLKTSPEKLLNQQLTGLIAKQDVETYVKHQYELFNFGQTQSFEIQLQLRDQTIIPVAIRVTTLSDNDGGQTFLWLIRDITQQKQVEAQLRNLSDRLSLAVKSGGFGIWEWDVVQNRLIWDERMYELYGVQPSDAAEAYQTWAKGLHPDDREQAETVIQQALRGEREFKPEFRVVHPDGSIRYIKAYSLLQRNETGEPQRMVGVNFDITNSKQAEEQLRRINERLTLTNAELDRATRLKDEFLANMSHELRTPLNAILGMSEGLQDGVFGILTDRQKKAVDSIARGGKHLLALINDVLDLAKVESGKLQLQLAPTSIAYICGNSLTFVRQQAMKKKIKLTTEISSGLANIVVDELRIRQVLINLLSNAVKFTPDGGSVKLVVEPVQSPDKNLLRFSVIDTGIGMTQEDAGKLFQPFVQIDSRLNRQYNGTGLGLALVRRLVELHNGTVGVTSEVGRGSCFTFCLPYVVSESTTVQTSSSQFQSITNEQLQQPEVTTNLTLDTSQTQANSPVILLVEDNDFNIASISCYLDSRGYELIVAKNGEEGVRIAKSEHPDLILMDIQLPKVDGLEAIRQIRADEQLVNTPIIALTALAMPGDREKCLASGANEYITKPVKLRELVDNIQSLLKKRSFKGE